MWSVEEYRKFSDERSRPFFDLLAQVPNKPAPFIVDLGCGTGHLTRTLAERWPDARVIGVDNSPEMLAQAFPLAIPGRLDFVLADLEDWRPSEPVDLLVSNAVLHWCPDHAGLLSRLAAMLAPGGTLAVQMPNRFHTPSQIAIEETSADPRWASSLEGVGLHRESVMPLPWYVHFLQDLGFKVNAWETTYLHILKGENAVLKWLKGTALRPLLQVLEPTRKGEFLGELGRRLQEAYPSQGDVTLFAFPRVFIVAEL